MVCDPPVPPEWDSNSLDDEDYHLEEKHKEEKKETDGAVSPKKTSTKDIYSNKQTNKL